MGLVWGLGGFGGFDTFFFSLCEASRQSIYAVIKIFYAVIKIFYAVINYYI